MNLLKYIGYRHSYGTLDCIKLLEWYYYEELGIKLLIPSYSTSRVWMKEFTTDFIDTWAAKYTEKIVLTAARNYDLIVFKASNSNHLIHFGMYVQSNKMLHVEESSFSKVELISEYWRSHIYGIYRYESLV